MYNFGYNGKKMRRKVRFPKMTQKRLESRCLIYNYSRLSRYEHLHSRFEMVAPTNGRVLARVDGKEYPLEPGDMLVVFPGMPHCYDPSETSEGYMLTFHSEMLGDLEETMMGVQPADPLIHLSAHDRDVLHCFDRLTEMAGGKINETLAQAYLNLMFLRLADALSLKQTDPTASKELLYRAMQYISQNLSQPLSIRQTAHVLGVNSYYLSHVLNERLHMGFRAYLNALRIERARRYLRVTAWSIEEVAAACGFLTLRTFDRVFLELCGCTPREFRKSIAVGTSSRGSAPAPRSRD